VGLVVFGYAIPLAIAVLLLFLLKDTVIAVALICVEASTMIGIHVAMRVPQPKHRRERLPGEPILGLPGDVTRAQSARDMKLVMTGMIGIVLLLAGLSVLASHAG
jgi:hypothetical protein